MGGLDRRWIEAFGRCDTIREGWSPPGDGIRLARRDRDREIAAGHAGAVAILVKGSRRRFLESGDHEARVRSLREILRFGDDMSRSAPAVVYDLDPMFCDEDAGDFGLKPGSPCLAGILGGRECELIGAYPMCCGASHTIATTWGQLKLQFR